MQRVLSFQMARGLSESSEFVTKRMCFSLIFSAGFLSLLCGFLLGRFATQRAIEYRMERKRMELAGNGLENTEHLQHSLLEQLQRAPLDPDFETKWEAFDLKENNVHHVNDVLKNLSLIEKVVQRESYVLATARGYREPDRYVVVSASGEGVGVALELAKIFSEIQREHKWKPRRSLVFCLFSGSLDPCAKIFPTLLPHRIVAYILVHQKSLQGKGPFTVSGSDIVQSMVLESTNTIKNRFSYNNQLLSLKNISFNAATPRLAVDIPHAVVSFMNSNAVTHDENHHELRKIILAQILGHTIWRFSESLIIKWNPNRFNETVHKALEPINNVELLQDKKRVQQTLDKLLTSIRILNGNIDSIDFINTLDTRILNDLLMDLDRVLLCSDNQLKSKTDWSEFSKISHEPSNLNEMQRYMNAVVKCYEDAIQLVQDR